MLEFEQKTLKAGADTPTGNRLKPLRGYLFDLEVFGWLPNHMLNGMAHGNELLHILDPVGAGSKENKMDSWIGIAVAIFASVMASSGFWTWLHNRTGRQSISNQLLLGLAHERIVHIGSKYVARGWITYNEYEDFIKYLYKPYSSFGGNGMVDKVKEEVTKLPLRSSGGTNTEVDLDYTITK